MIPYLLFVGLLLGSGIAVGEFFKFWRKEDSLIIRLGWAFGLGASFNVFLFFARSFIPITVSQTIALTIVISFLLLAVSMLSRHAFSFPKRPTRHDAGFLFLLAISFTLVFSQFAKFPVFPQFRSDDLELHARIVGDYAAGRIPAIFSQALYYGSTYLVSAFAFLENGEPLVSSRHGIAILVALSPLAIYLAAFHLFGNQKAALTSALLWVIGAYNWHGMVFNSGLYPNFYSILSSFWLLAISIRFMREEGFSKVSVLVGASPRFSFSSMWFFRLPLLLLVMANALLSHYTIAFVFAILPIILLAYGYAHRVFRRGIVLALSFSLPLVGGFLLFPELPPLMLGFLSGGGFPPRPTFLSSLMPLPVLSHMVAEVTNDWLSLFLLASIFVYSYVVVKKRFSLLLLIPLLLFVFIVVISPLEVISWRYAFMALMPLTPISGYCLSLLLPDRFSFRKSQTYGRIFKVTAFSFLIVFPVFLPNSWSAKSLGESMTDTSVVAASEYADLKAMKWIAANLPNKEFLPVKILSVSDSRFLYSQLVTSQGIQYAPRELVNGSHFPWNDPSQLAIFAARNGIDYLIVTRVITETLGTCAKTLNIELVANSTSVKPGGEVLFTIAQSASKDLPGALIVNDEWIQIETVNGTQGVTLTFQREGIFKVSAIFGTTVTERIRVDVVGSNPTPTLGASVGVPADYCHPWFSMNPYLLGNIKTVYEDEYVRILKLGG